MAIDSGQIDLNADALLLDKENEVMGFNPLGPNVGVGASHDETLASEPVGVGVGVGGDIGGKNSGLLEPLSEVVVGEFGMNLGCDVMVNGSGKEEGFCKGDELVGGGNGLEVGLELGDVGCHGELSGGLVLGNDDRKILRECSEVAPRVCGGALANGAQGVDNVCVVGEDGTKTEVADNLFTNEGLEEGAQGVVDNACVVGEDGTKTEVADNLVTNEGLEEGAQGVDNACMVGEDGTKTEVADNLVTNEGLEEGVQGVDNACMVGEDGTKTEVADNLVTNEGLEEGAQGVDNVCVVGEDGTKTEVADNLVTNEGLEECHALEVLTCQVRDGFPDMGVVGVNAKELLHYKHPISGNQHVLTTSYEAKQPASHVDDQVEATQNQTVDIHHAEAGHNEDIQSECHGFNLVVDLNSYKNMLGVELYRGSVFSEQNFCVSDLVWGKVMGHPWWPGQIVDPSAASEKALRHLKKDGYLIAYFGDRTFSWNDSSMIKPFQMHFSQMMKQSHLGSFHHAVDCSLAEVSRRVEFGLSCPCLPKEVFSKLITQVIPNAGICKQSRRRHGGDRFINAASFEPMKLVNFVKSFAKSPLTESDRLDFVIARAHLSAFNRSKGYSQLPEFAVHGGLLNDEEILLMKEKEQPNDQIDGKGMITHLGFSNKRKHNSGDSKRPGRRHKRLSDLMSVETYFVSDAEPALERKAGDQPVPRQRGRKRKAVSSISDDNIPNSQTSKSAQLLHVSIYEMWSQLCLAATDPLTQICLSDTVYFFAEFRNFITRNSSAYLEQEMSMICMHAGDGEAGVTSIEPVCPPMTPAIEPCNDSYWTDRIIQCIPEEQSSSKNQNGRAYFFHEAQTESGYPFSKPQPTPETSLDRNQGLEPSKFGEHLDQSSAEETNPTALSLKFTSLDSVPSTTDLNKIFGRYGPLIESRTELIEKSNRARVVFKRRSDAETAFSSAGKFSIFGPSLVSYRLKILPRKPQKGTGKRGRKSRKETTSSVHGAAV